MPRCWERLTASQQRHSKNRVKERTDMSMIIKRSKSSGAPLWQITVTLDCGHTFPVDVIDRDQQPLGLDVACSQCRWAREISP
jgi:hypothetical protein